jgi:hypothetical protein
MVQAPAIAIINKTPCQSGTPRGAVGRVSGSLGGLSWETDVRVMVAALYPGCEEQGEILRFVAARPENGPSKRRGHFAQNDNELPSEKPQVSPTL